jgi:AcrR family transcriptional regulator
MTQGRTPYDAKLESILRAAAQVFAEMGYHRASIRDIARSTGVSLSGLYYYFQSKEELLFLIQSHALDLLVTGLEERLAFARDPQEKLRVLIDNQLRFFVENMSEMKVLSHEGRSLTGEFRANVEEQLRRMTNIVREILREVAPNSPLDERVSAFALFGMMNWIYVWYRPERDADVDTLVRDMTAIFMDGFLRSAEARTEAPRLTPAAR